MTEKENKTVVDEFGWDENVPFFDVPAEDNKEPVEESTEEPVEESKENSEKEPKKEPEKKEVKFTFGETPNSVPETEKKDSKYNELVKSLTEKGVIPEELVKDETVEDESDFLALFEKTVNTRFQEEVKGFVDNLPDEGKRFIEYLRQGGDANTFFNTYKEVTAIPTLTEDKSNAEQIVEFYLKKVKGIDDPEDIKDTIEVFKEKGKLDGYAEKYNELLTQMKQKEEEELLKSAELRKKQEEEARRQFANNIEETIDSNKKFGIIELSEKEKAELKEYILKPAGKKDNGYIPQFTKDLQEVFKNPEQLIVLAKLLREGLDLTFLEKKLNTEVVNKTKQAINKNEEPKLPAGSVLADLF